MVQNSKAQVTPTRGQKIEHAAPLPHAQLGTLHTTQSAQLVPLTSMALNLEVSNKAPALPIESWGLVVCCLWEILCNRGLFRCFWLLRKCAAAVLIFVLDAGYDMHTYGAFSHKMRLAAKSPPLLLYFSNISEYLTVAEIRILRVGRVV